MTTRKKPASTESGTTIEVKIGVQFSQRELVVETLLSAEQIREELAAASSESRAFSLTDSKGRVIVVPHDKIAYLEIGEPLARTVGFHA